MSVVDPPSPAVALPDGTDVIQVRGARMHNLRNLDLDLPRDRLIVLTGPSGSGKSSLAFDTIYAEGQRQYLETLSVYARQFLHQMERPEVDEIAGLPPTICIDQRAGAANPRSTVATVTEIYDFLRLLYARLGETYCYQCNAPIRQQTPEQIQDRIVGLPTGTKLILMAPLVRGRKGEQQAAFDQARKAGFVRVRVDGTVYEIEQAPPLSPKKSHTIDAVVDRIVVRPGIEGRIGDSVRLALRHGEGLAVALYYIAAPESGAGPPTPSSGPSANETRNGGTWHEELFSTLYACPNCQISYEEVEPRTFSFNSPYGACPVCEGLGSRVEFDPELVLPERDQSLADGAIAPWRGVKSAVARRGQEEIARFVSAERLDEQSPLSAWNPASLHKLLHGDEKKFPGLLLLLEKEFATATPGPRLTELESYRGSVPCTACGGSRLRREAGSVRVFQKAIHEVTRQAIGEASQWFASLKFPKEQRPIADPLLREITRRLDFLRHVGVDYLTLDRPADTLSGGELQRVRLATSIGSGLVGVCYVLDEPSIGLHQRDNQRLIEALRDLQRQGNTVVVVEHDEAMMREADWLIDIGPGAGSFGGRIVAQGTPVEVARHPDSLTGRYLGGAERIEVPSARRRVSKSRAITLEGATANNLRDVTVHVPLGALVCVTGVSGSGKSSLVNETLAPALIRRLGGIAPKPGPFRGLRGVNQIDKVISIDQSPLGRTPRSNPATYTGVFDEVRKVFAGTREAKQWGFGAGRFSFNAAGGRCEACQGQGVQKIEMNFLPDLYVACAECGGARFNRQTLAVKYRGKSIAGVLDLSVEEAAEFFVNFPAISRVLLSMRDVGLGYLQLGRPSTTLSGGEAQRIKLATELARVDTGRTLYLLDEPTTGLHFDDIKKLLGVLSRLVDKGNTVLVIEHNLDVIKCADWLIDLGPEGGAGGGRILATGTPEEVAALADNSTGQFLKALLPTP